MTCLDNLKPGRELDVLVAEKVIGWRWEGLWIISPNEQRWEISTREALDFAVPRFSADIAAAWEVVEKLEKDIQITKQRRPCTEISDQEETWYYAFIVNGDGFKAETAPHAICLAALKALGAI